MKLEEQTEADTDYVVDEIRRVRHQISAEHGHDITSLMEALRRQHQTTQRAETVDGPEDTSATDNVGVAPE